jgi:hypothetical protein
MTFQVFKVVSMKMTAFWDIALYNLLKKNDISEVRTVSLIRAMMEATSLP